METLPGDNQLALSLYYMSDLSVKEIASFMGVSPNTVKGKPQKLGIDGLSHISLHPDGQRVAFTATSPGYGQEIWAMENFLPESTASR
jgi:hypothetical protein